MNLQQVEQGQRSFNTYLRYLGRVGADETAPAARHSREQSENLPGRKDEVSLLILYTSPDFEHDSPLAL